MATRDLLTVNLKLRIDEELHDALQRLAAAGDRNVQQEMRRGLRDYVARQDEAKEQAP